MYEDRIISFFMYIYIECYSIWLWYMVQFGDWDPKHYTALATVIAMISMTVVY